MLVVDDGIATGATAVAAVRSAKASGAAKVVLAAPVAACRASAEMLREEADEVVCLIEDPSFFAVGHYYVDFRQMDDDEVKALLDGRA